MLTFKEICDKAEAKGATPKDIVASAEAQRRNVGTVPFNNMIRALQLMTWRNTKEDWVRLAGALLARKVARAEKRQKAAA